MADWEQIADGTLGEQYFRTAIAGGPVVYVVPRPGYAENYATFATRYGSIDNSFVVSGRQVCVPDGIAHFLEHQMFAQEDGDAFERFSALGVSANAFTSYSATTYLFQGTDNFEPAFTHLLDFVQEPHFTDAGTDKERGIIQQEIRMYEDSAGWRLQQRLGACLYARHPFAIPIAGTVESVGKITTDDLRLCYQTFYQPGNMVITAVGDLDPDRVLAKVAESLERHPHPPFVPAERILPDEGPSVASAFAEERMPIARPMLAVGFKERDVPVSGRRLLERDIRTTIALEAIFGRSGALYQELYERGLIDGGFGAGYYGEATFGCSRVGGETDDPEALREAIIAAVRRARSDGIPSEAVERQRRAIFGHFVRLFNAPEGLGHALGELHFAGVDLFAYLDVLQTTRPRDIDERARRHLDPDYAAIVIIRPS